MIKGKKKFKLKDKPNQLIEKIIEEFKFETPKKLPKICSLISGYFSYDSIRYVEKIPNNCKNDLNLPDVRLLRPRTLVIHDNLKKEIVDLASDVLAKEAPSAAFKLVEVLETNKPMPQANVKLQAAQTILDRVGLGKKERLDVNHNVQGGIFILPEKETINITDYEELSE